MESSNRSRLDDPVCRATSQRFRRIIDDCQIAIGESLNDDADLTPIVARLLKAAANIDQREVVLIKSVLLHLLFRLKARSSLAMRDDRIIQAGIEAVLGQARLGAAAPTCSDPVARLAVSRVTACLQIIKTQFRNSDLTLHMVSRQLEVSRWHLSRLIKRTTGFGFHWHLQQARLEEGCALLRNTRLSVKEITGAIGYKQVSDFDRVFKNQRAVTPTEYRLSSSTARA